MRSGTRFDSLAREALSRLESEITRPLRDPGDWSIELAGGCACPVCATFTAFLADPKLRALDWPLKQESRRHVHGRIDEHELPVRHVTRRVGRPYVLQLSKTPLLFEREKQERQADEADLRWLRAVTR